MGGRGIKEDGTVEDQDPEEADRITRNVLNGFGKVIRENQFFDCKICNGFACFCMMMGAPRPPGVAHPEGECPFECKICKDAGHEMCQSFQEHLQEKMAAMQLLKVETEFESEPELESPKQRVSREEDSPTRTRIPRESRSLPLSSSAAETETKAGAEASREMTVDEILGEIEK